MLTGFARALRLPGHDAAAEVEPYLRMVVELRREQAYPVAEVLREFSLLSEIVLDETVRLFEGELDEAAPAVARLVSFIHRAMQSVALIAVDNYQEAFLREKQELSERLSDFAQKLEHELRGPLQAAAAGIGILREEQVAQDPARRAYYAELISERLGRISRLIVDLRELATAEEGLTREERKPVRTVVQEVFDEVRALADAQGVELKVAEPLAEILVDPARIQVALMNLVNNAIKYCDPEKSRRWVTVSLDEAASHDMIRWELSVSDNGQGIPKDVQSQVFQRYIRVHPEAAPGTGLGRAIVKEVMEQRGGAVRVESTQGEGSTFTLVLSPRLAEPQKTRPPGHPDGEGDSSLESGQGA